MAIVNRIQRLFRADVHAVLDIIEEPEAILKQAIREMQEALDRKRARLARNQNKLRTLKASEAYLKEEIGKIHQDLELCLKEGSEEVVRKTVGRKLGFQKSLTVIQQKVSTWETLCEQQIQEIDLQQSQLESIIGKAKMFVHTARQDLPFSVAESILAAADQSAAPSYPGTMPAHVSEEEIELEWIRLRESFREGGAA